MAHYSIDWSAQRYEDVLRAFTLRIPARLNIARLCCDDQDPAAIALVDVRRRTTTTFAELADASSRLALALQQRGVGSGDRVAVLVPPRLDNALAHLAAFRLGAVSVPLSPLFGVDALSHRLSASRAKVLICDDAHAAVAEAASSEGVHMLRCSELAALLDSIGPTAPFVADTQRDDPAMLIFTSGTSGMPKGALHAHRFVAARLPAFDLVQELSRSAPGQTGGRKGPFWTPADWAWVAGLVDSVLTPWAFGRPVLAAERSGPFDPAEAVMLMRTHRVSGCFMPPTALAKLREAFPDGVDLNVTLHTAGEPLHAELYAWAAKSFRHAREIYGMTEVGALVGSHRFVPHRPGAMGKPLPGHEVVLIDEEGQVLDGPAEGEIAVRRDDQGLMLGYDDRALEDAAHFHTGDLARRDADGYLWYLGRNDDVFNTSGYRVGPSEIERSLCLHEAVSRAAVVGLPDPDRGTAIVAFVVLHPEHAPSEALVAALQTHVRERLAAYQYPRRVVFARDLPTTVTGKVQRSLLREPGAVERYGM